jgi:tetratricopeptide (TPR) repeat protein
VLLLTRHFDEAMDQFRQALKINPGYAEAHNDLGNALLQLGRRDEAIEQFRRALEIQPDYGNAHFNLGNAFRESGRAQEAIGHYQKVLQIQPGYIEAENNLAYVLATCPQASLRDGAKALDLAQQADRASGGRNAIVLGTLATAFAENGKFTEALDAAQRALDLANSQSNPTLADVLRSNIALYKTGRPFRDASLGAPDVEK